MELHVDTLAEQMRRRQRAGRLIGALLALLGAGAVAATLIVGLPRSRPAPPPLCYSDHVFEDFHAGYSKGARARRKAVFAAADDDRAFTRKPPPQPGEWLHGFREPGQTVAEHARDCRNRRTAERHTLHLLPYTDLGPAGHASLPTVVEFVEAWFVLDAQTLPMLEPPSAAWNPQRAQWHAERIADALEARVPADSLGVVGLLGRDMYVDGLNFVFGIGRFTRRVGVHSLHRFGDEPGARERRVLALMAHELGHMFGLEHCVFYACVMNGINSLDESDRTPLHLCPVCREKLRHAIGFEHGPRYAGLEAFFEARGMSVEADFARRQAARFRR